VSGVRQSWAIARRTSLSCYRTSVLKRYHGERTVTSGFDILPAIDLLGGRVVRLEQGDFGRETAFSNDPLAVSVSFEEAGARWLHIVDLDGARTGLPVHAAVIRAIVGAVGRNVSVEVAGGLRTEDSVATVLAAGARRVVVGTAALRDPTFAGRLVATHGSHRVVVALDVRDGLALGEGWRKGAAGIDAADVFATLADQGVTTFEATAIERDGLLRGPNLDLLTRLVGLDRGAVIASGGIASLDDIRAVRQLGCSGAIVGRALYEGRFDIASAMRA
jgi:phosphoribosylformimino-5-aminoimidazole carboxamide ribotide isomerase